MRGRALGDLDQEKLPSCRANSAPRPEEIGAGENPLLSDHLTQTLSDPSWLVDAPALNVGHACVGGRAYAYLRIAFFLVRGGRQSRGRRIEMFNEHAQRHIYIYIHTHIYIYNMHIWANCYKSPTEEGFCEGNVANPTSCLILPRCAC